MANTTINIDTRQLDRLTKELKGFEKEVAQATALALNRTIDYTATQIGRIVPQYYQIKNSEVKATLSKNKPSKTNLNASITSKGHTLSLAHFPFTPKTAKRSTRSAFDSAVMVTIKKGKKVMSKKGFVAHTGAKSADKIQYNVFKRVGKNRLPIAPIRTLSIPQMITNANVADQVQILAVAKLDERLEHEIIRAMTTISKRVGGK